MSLLTSGRTEPCKDNVGGIKEVWLSAFVPYPQNLIIGFRDMLVTSFPLTLFYKYEGREKSSSESIRDDGGYDQEITFKLIKQDVFTSVLSSILINQRTRAVVIDNTGKIKVFGIHNGLDASINATGGSSKSDFNGYDIRLTGMEPYKAPFISAFPGYGFVKEGVEYSCLYSSSGRPSSLADLVSSCNVPQ